MTRKFIPIAAALMLGSSGVPAAAELLIAPTRLILSPDERSGELVLVNKSEDTAGFRISIENRRMLVDGSMELAQAPRDDERFAAHLLRVSPRQLTMEPGDRQVLRVSSRSLGNLSPGEYRAHLRLMSAPISEATASAEPVADNSLAIQLIAIRSLTIPVIVRVGDLSVEARIDGAAFSAEDSSLLAVRLNRIGNRSTYGDLRFTIEGEIQPAYLVRGVAVYVPNADRDVLVPIPDDIRARFAGQRIRVEYISRDPSDSGTIASLTAQL